MQCSNNLKQLGLATHNYHDNFSKLPPMSNWVNNKPGSNRETCIFYLLLPYIEQKNLQDLNKTQKNQGYYFPGAGWTDYCVDIGQNIVKTYLCPSDGTNTDHFDKGSIDNYGPLFATGSYSANVKIFDPNPQSRTLVGAMPSGTSNSVIFGHRLEFCDAGDPNFGYNDWDATPDQTGTFHPLPGFGYGGAAITINGVSYNHGYFLTRCPQPDTALTCYKGPNNTLRRNLTNSYPRYLNGSLPFQIQPRPGNCDPSVLASPHSGVMPVGLGDGSVRSVSPSISLATWVTACDPDIALPLGSDW
jgi:hypothetical protein